MENTMAARKLKANQDQHLIFWDAKKTLIDDARKVFKSVKHVDGKTTFEDCVPEASPQDSIKRAATEIVKALELNDKPVRFFPLTGDDSGKVGVECRQFIRGQKRNELPFMFSLGIVEDEEIVGLDGTQTSRSATKGSKTTVNSNVQVKKTMRVVIRDLDTANKNMSMYFDATNVVKMKQLKKIFCSKAQNFFDEQVLWITANQLTHCIHAYIREWGGFRLVSSGANWFLPAEGMVGYRKIADGLGANLHELTFDPLVNDGLMQHVANELEEQTKQMCEEIQSHYSALEEGGKASRANGRMSHLQELVEANDRLEANRELVTTRIYDALTASIKATEAAIGEEAFEL
jgi:hypothetical protein